jgi:putative ABC transport system permease protein
MNALGWLDTLRVDMRFAFRTLYRSPGFTITILLTLAVCIGANTALFSLVDAAILRPLAYPDPDRLGLVITRYGARGADDDTHTGQTWFFIRDYAKAFDAAVFSGLAGGVNFAANGRAVYVQQERVGAGFFRVLGVRPLIGREFSPLEDSPGGPAVALLSYQFWRQVFQGDPLIVGRTVMLRGEPHVVVGVMPPGLETAAKADLWTPLRPSTVGEGEGANYQIIVRLRPGTTWNQATAQIATIGESALSEERSVDPSAHLIIAPLQRGLTENVRKPLFMLWAAVGIVLLIGCVNIASLLLARGMRRGQEIATRLALGAARGTILRQLLTESLLLAIGGGIGGLILGYWALQGLRTMAHDSLHLWQNITLDGRALGATITASLLSSVAFGLLPAVQASRTDIRMSLGEGGRRATSRGHRWARSLLVVAEVALGVVLLVGAGLLLRTFAALRSLRPGFDASRVITAQLSLQDARYTTNQKVNWLFTETLARIRALPDVEMAAIGLGLPYERYLRLGFHYLDGPRAKGGQRGNTTASYVTPDYFQALRIPLERGRLLRDSDGPNAQKVIVVNKAFARRYFPDQEPIGSHIEIELTGGPSEIVGVVGDIQQQAGWGNHGPIAALPCAFFPIAQANGEMLQLVHKWFSPSWIVRTAALPETAAIGIQRAVEAVDPQLPIASFRSMEQVRRRAIEQQRFQAILLAMLAGIALLLAATGIYGLIAQSVAQRTREVGIRLALGASRWQVMRAVALPGILLALVGVLIGCVLARIAVQSLQRLVWGIQVGDPATFVGIAVGLSLVATVASILPTFRLARIDPAQTLRNDG